MKVVRHSSLSFEFFTESKRREENLKDDSVINFRGSTEAEAAEVISRSTGQGIY